MPEISWRDLFSAAILELDPALLQVRVKAAEDAINARLADAQVPRGERRAARNRRRAIYFAWIEATATIISSRYYLGGSEVPKLGCASSHGFPSTSAICALQTRLTTNGHLATYFASRGQCRASQSRFPEMGSNSGPRLLFSIEAPTVSAMPYANDDRYLRYARLAIFDAT
jgi:hypothetical protein